MALTAEAKAKLEQLLDFQCALLAGAGDTRPYPDERGQRFDAILKEGGFAQTGLATVATALMENIRRLRGQAGLPMILFNYGRDFQVVVSEICVKNDFDRMPVGIIPPGASEEWILQETRKLAVVEEELRKWILGIEQRVPKHVGGSYFHVAGITGVSHEVMTHYQREIRNALNDFCASLVIQAWTLFESLSQDLWEAALNSHPKTLALLAGKHRSKFRSRQQEPMESGEVAKKDRGVLLSLNDLQKHSFELRSQMGTILKGRFSFKAIDGIRSAYFQAFSKPNATNPVIPVLEDEGLQYAAAVRNLLVHKGGVVDQEFLDQTALVSHVPKLQIGKEFPLTGKVCAELSDSCRCCAVWLVMAVHEWIIDQRSDEVGDAN